MDSPGQLAFTSSLRGGPVSGGTASKSRRRRPRSAGPASGLSRSFAADTAASRASRTGGRFGSTSSTSVSGSGSSGNGGVLMGGGAMSARSTTSGSVSRPTFDLSATLEKTGAAMKPSQRAQLQYLAEKIKQVVMKLQEEEQRRITAETKLNEARGELAHWKSHAGDLRSKYGEAAQSAGLSLEQHEAVVEQMKALETEKAQLEQSHSNAQTAVGQLTRMNDMLMDRMEVLTREKAAADEGHRCAVRGLDEQLANAQRTIGALEDELAAAKQATSSTIADIHARQDELRSGSGRLRKRVEVAEAKANESTAEVRRLTDARDVCQSELRRTIRRCSTLEKTNEALTKELDRAADETESLRSRLETQRTRTEQLTSDVSRLNRQVEQHDRLLDDAKRQAKATRLRADKADATHSKKLGQMAAERSALQEEVDELKARVEQLAADNSHLQALDATRESHEQRAAAMSAKLDEEAKESERLRGELSEAVKSLLEARQARGEAEAKVTVLQNDAFEMGRRLETVSREASDAIAGHRNHLARHETTVLNLETQLDNLRDDKEELESALRLQRLSQDETLREMAEIRTERDGLRSAMKDLEAQYVALQEEATQTSVDALRRSTASSTGYRTPTRVPHGTDGARSAPRRMVTRDDTATMAAAATYTTDLSGEDAGFVPGIGGSGRRHRLPPPEPFVATGDPASPPSAQGSAVPANESQIPLPPLSSLPSTEDSGAASASAAAAAAAPPSAALASGPTSNPGDSNPNSRASTDHSAGAPSAELVAAAAASGRSAAATGADGAPPPPIGSDLDLALRWSRVREAVGRVDDEDDDGMVNIGQGDVDEEDDEDYADSFEDETPFATDEEA